MSKKGAGIMDIIKNPIDYINEVSSKIPTKLNNISTSTLKQYGNIPIRTLSIIRSPLKDIMLGALNKLSFGKFEELQKKHNLPVLYHLSLVAGLETGENIIIEKNEVVHVDLLKKENRIDSTTEYMDVPVNKTITLTDMIDKTIKLMGNERFFDYDGLGVDGKANNCQNFVLGLLSSVGLLTNKEYKFIHQDVSKLTQDFNNSNYSYVPKAMQKVTRIGSTLSRLLAKGKSKSKESKMIGGNVSPDLLNFIKNDGWALF